MFTDDGALQARMSTHPMQATWALKRPQQLVYVELGPHNGGMMLGICELGLTFRAVAPLQANRPLPFSFALDGKSRLQGVGEIAWTEDDGKTGGLKFTNVSTEFRAALRSWLAGEASPKCVGRELTPAAALPLDSIEKIKSSIREGNIEEIKASAPTRQTEEKPPQTKSPETRPPETMQLETKSAEIKHAAPEPVLEKPIESVPPLPKFRLPSAPAPEAPPNEPVAQVEALPAAPTLPVHPDPHTPAEMQKEYPPLEGLHQPYAHVSPEAEEIEESPRLNRAAAAGIIALALAVILVALVVSFRREVGETLIRIGEKLAGQNRAAVPVTRPETNPSAAASQPQVTPVPTNSGSAPSGAPDSANAARTTAPATNSIASSTIASVPSQSGKVQRIEDLQPPSDGGSGQREFEQARNVLKGNHRQRDISVAVDLLWTGVRKGYVPAEVTLADLYARGDGVEQSCEQARVLLRAAIQKGSPEGRRRLDQLSRQGCPSN